MRDFEQYTYLLHDQAISEGQSTNQLIRANQGPINQSDSFFGDPCDHS